MELESVPRLIEGLQLTGDNQSPGETPDKVLRREPWTEESLRRIIRKMGLKVTSQRLAILAALTSGRVHVTAQEVYEGVYSKYPEIGFATVYRFLRNLVQSQLVTEVRMGGLPARYELTPIRHHDHLTCTKCGRIVEFEDDEIERLQDRVAKRHKFLLTHHVLELYGLCQVCQTT